MHLCMDFVKFVLEASGDKILSEGFYFGVATILWQFANPFRGASIM